MLATNFKLNSNFTKFELEKKNEFNIITVNFTRAIYYSHLFAEPVKTSSYVTPQLFLSNTQAQVSKSWHNSN